MAKVRKQSKICALTGFRFPLSEFYKNANTHDGLHPYSKGSDNFRRSLSGSGFGVPELRQLFTNLLTKTN